MSTPAWVVDALANWKTAAWSITTNDTGSPFDAIQYAPEFQGRVSLFPPNVGMGPYRNGYVQNNIVKDGEGYVGSMANNGYVLGRAKFGSFEKAAPGMIIIVGFTPTRDWKEAAISIDYSGKTANYPSTPGKEFLAAVNANPNGSPFQITRSVLCTDGSYLDPNRVSDHQTIIYQDVDMQSGRGFAAPQSRALVLAVSPIGETYFYLMGHPIYPQSLRPFAQGETAAAIPDFASFSTHDIEITLHDAGIHYIEILTPESTGVPFAPEYLGDGWWRDKINVQEHLAKAPHDKRGFPIG